MEIQNYVDEIKQLFENAILNDGLGGKTSLIRSQKLINILHEAVKGSLISNNVRSDNILPPLGQSKPELKIAGFLKKKDQDICVVPDGINKEKRLIDWGPLKAENQVDNLGSEYAENTLVINVRSQLSSLAKNTDTLFERTFAEALNLHIIYPKMVLGEVYLIPVYEYNDTSMISNKIEFKNNSTNLEKYISFFTSLNRRKDHTDSNEVFKYERCALIIVDFSKTPCKIYTNTEELKVDNLVSKDFSLELHDISFDHCISDLLTVYSQRFNIDQIASRFSL